MQLFSFISCLFLLILSTKVLSADTEEPPGFRTIYVKNHASFVEGKSDYLDLYRRNCEHPKRKKKAYCRCWENFAEEDDPVVQGSPLSLVILPTLLKDPPPLVCEKEDEETKEDYLQVPSPGKLLSLLKEIGRSELYEFAANDELVSVDRYLEFIAAKKVPMAGLGDLSQHAESAYRTYFHDLFNHLNIRLYAPESYWDLLARRATHLLKMTEDIAIKHGESTTIKDILYLLKFFAALEQDVSIGMVNNHIFYYELIKSGDEKLSLSKYCACEKTTVMRFLEQSINFGSKNENSNKKYVISVEKNAEEFSSSWVIYFSDKLLNEFLHKQLIEFESYKIIERDPIAHQALLRLYSATKGQLEGDFSLIKNHVSQIDYKRDFQYSISFKSLLSDINNNMQAVTESWQSFCKNAKAEEPLQGF